MDSYQQEITLITKILKENPKGMTVTDISRKIKINRNSVAKYLDIMRISGLVEMITFGPAKVFFPVRRIPLGNIINYTSDYLIIFNDKLKIVMTNDPLLHFMRCERDDLIGRSVTDTSLSILEEELELSSDIQDALEGNEVTKELLFHVEGEERYCIIRILPTSFEDGENGATMILTDKTDQKVAEKTLRESEEKFRELLKKMNEK
ncbi:MAG: PAS domain-containing protein [Candidatus Thermoplasmatota archaeon]|nr:PAS domain-containing protein [Candidatus Thermoplasmatota archaeon]